MTTSEENLPIPSDIQIDSLSPARGQIWDQTAAGVMQMQSGRLPDDVAAEIKRRASESVAIRGFGIGKMGAALTLRDLGVSALSQREKGLTLGMEMGKQEGSWNLAEAELEQKRQLAQIQAQQQQQQINQDWFKTRETMRLGNAELGLKSAEALTANRAARLDAELKLLQMNAVYGNDVQTYLDQIGGANGQIGYFEQPDSMVGKIAAQFQ